MDSTKLSNIVKTVRLRYAVPFVVLLAAVYLTTIHPWMMNYGSTVDEQQMVLPGDDLSANNTGQNTLAVTINAPSDGIWQWLVQVGQDRAGFYTYTWLENLVGADIHNANEIHPEWQTLNVGAAWRLVSPDYLWGLGKDAASRVLISEPGYALVLEMFGAHVILPIDGSTSRLIVRGQSGPANLLSMMIVDPVVFTMERRMMLGLKARAEGYPDAPAALMVIAQVGWAAACILIAGHFITRRQRICWLGLPVAAAMPALLMSSDLQAAMAAFIAVGFTVLGFINFGRNWWGPFLIIGSVVMLTLLLAPEAYTAFGLAFAMISLAVLLETAVARSRSPEGAARRFASHTR